MIFASLTLGSFGHPIHSLIITDTYVLKNASNLNVNKERRSARRRMRMKIC